MFRNQRQVSRKLWRGAHTRQYSLDHLEQQGISGISKSRLQPASGLCGKVLRARIGRLEIAMNNLFVLSGLARQALRNRLSLQNWRRNGRNHGQQRKPSDPRLVEIIDSEERHDVRKESGTQEPE